MKRPGLAAAGCFALLALALFAPAFFGGRLFFPIHTEQLLPWRSEVPAERLAEHAARANPELSDKLWLLHPNAQAMVAAWKEGEVPAWNPAIVGGAPLLGEALDGALYPPNLLLLAFDRIERGFAWIVALHVVIAGLGAFVLARRLALAFAPALLAGVLFGAGGALLVQYHLHMRFFALAWVPWLFAAVHAFGERPSLLRFAAIPPPIALVVLSGFPQTGLYGVVGAGIFGAFRLVALHRRRSWQPLLALAGAFALGAGLAAAQILPVDDTLKRSLPRAHSVDQQIEESGTRWMLAGYLVPGAFQDPRGAWSQTVYGNPLWNALYCDVARDEQGRVVPSGASARPSTTETTCYLGAVGFVLALAALLTGLACGARAAAVAFGLFVTLVVCWAYALGDRWIVSAVALVPRMDVGEVRRILGTIGLLGALLAAIGAQRLLEPEARGARRLVVALAAAIALGLLGLFLAVDHAGPGGLLAWLRERQVARYGSEVLEQFAAAITPSPVVAGEIHEFVAGRLARSAAWFGAACVALFVVHRLVTAGRARAAAGVLVLAAAADLACLHFRVNPFVPSEGFLATVPLLAPLAAKSAGQANPMNPTGASDGRVHRFAPEFASGGDPVQQLVLPPNLGACFGIHDAEGYLVAMPTRYARYLRALEPEETPGQTVVTVAALPLRTAAALRSPLLDGMSVKHVLTREDLVAVLNGATGGSAAGDAGFRLVGQRGESRVYENGEALPFVSVMQEAWLLPPAPADDAIAIAADAIGVASGSIAADPKTGERDEERNRERYELHRAALHALATRPELLRRRVYMECEPPAPDSLSAATFAADSVDLPLTGGAGESGAEVVESALVTKLPRLATRGEPARVAAIERKPARLRVSLEGEGGGFLLVTGGFDPGWRATIDGVAAPVVPANVAFCGVVLPRGAREVVLEYRPESVRRGVVISLAALGALGLVVAFGLVRLVNAARGRPPASPLPIAAPVG